MLNTLILFCFEFYTYNFLGQLDQIATEIYNLELECQVLSTETGEVDGKTIVIVTLRLNFDNTHYVSKTENFSKQFPKEYIKNEINLEITTLRNIDYIQIKINVENHFYYFIYIG